MAGISGRKNSKKLRTENKLLNMLGKNGRKSSKRVGVQEAVFSPSGRLSLQDELPVKLEEKTRNTGFSKRQKQAVSSKLRM